MGLAAAWCGPESWMISNDEVAALMQASPNRILGAASANLLAPMEAVRDLRRAVKTLGFRALRLVLWLWNLPPNVDPTIHSLLNLLNASFESHSRVNTPCVLPGGRLASGAGDNTIRLWDLKEGAPTPPASRVTRLGSTRCACCPTGGSLGLQ